MWDSNVFFERDNFINFDFSINLKYVHIFREIFFVKVILVIVVIRLSLIHVFVPTDQLVINMKIEKKFTMTQGSNFNLSWQIT